MVLIQNRDSLKTKLKFLVPLSIYKHSTILSFDQSVFLNKAKVMYKVHNNIASSYLQELFHMRDANLNNTVARCIIILCLKQNVTYLRVVLPSLA